MNDNLQEKFRFSTEVSNDCYNCASDLNASARILYAAQGNLEGHPSELLGLPPEFDFRAGLSRPVFLNAGFALELILKACLIREKKFDSKKHFKHDLVALSHDAHVPYSSDQECTLWILADSTVWFGRYPHPKSPAELQKNKLNWSNLRKVEKFGSVTVSGSDENKWPTFQNYSELWRLAQYRYWEIEPLDPREFRRDL